MSLDALFDACFRHVSLVRVPSGAAPTSPAHSDLVTLEHVFNKSQFVVFALVAGTRGSELAVKLEHLCNARNDAKASKVESSPARIRRFFSLKKKSKKKDKEGKDAPPTDASIVSVVVIDVDHRCDDVQTSFARPGWYIAAPLPPATKSRLLRCLSFEVPPSLIVVDAASRGVVTTEARRLLHEDPNGEAFPWYPPLPEDVLKGELVRFTGDKQTTSSYSDCKAKVKAMFFGASWCPPCRQWTTQLAPVYTQLKKNGVDVEVIFCSSDRSPAAFAQFAGQMPWPAFAYNPQHTTALSRLFNVSGIPSMVLIDEENHVITRHGRTTLLGDPQGSSFPWGPRKMYELNELTVGRLRDEPALVLFTEGTPEDVSFSVCVLEQLAQQVFSERQERGEERAESEEPRDENGNGGKEECSSVDSDVPVPLSADPLQVFYTGEDPICDHILEKILVMPEAELPLICIVDALAGQFAVCEREDVDESVLSEFVGCYRAGKLSWRRLGAETEREVKHSPAGEQPQLL